MINVLKRTIFAFIAIFNDYPDIQVLVAQVRVDIYVDTWHACGVIVDMCADVCQNTCTDMCADICVD